MERNDQKSPQTMPYLGEGQETNFTPLKELSTPSCFSQPISGSLSTRTKETFSDETPRDEEKRKEKDLGSLFVRDVLKEPGKTASPEMGPEGGFRPPTTGVIVFPPPLEVVATSSTSSSSLEPFEFSHLRGGTPEANPMFSDTKKTYDTSLSHSQEGGGTLRSPAVSGEGGFSAMSVKKGDTGRESDEGSDGSKGTGREHSIQGKKEEPPIVKVVVPFRAVAVKHVSKENLSRAEHFNALLSEITMASHLNHKGLVNWFGVCEDEEHILLVMDLAENGNMLEYIEKFGVSHTREMAPRFMADIVLALEYLLDGSKHPYCPKNRFGGGVSDASGVEAQRSTSVHKKLSPENVSTDSAHPLTISLSRPPPLLHGATSCPIPQTPKEERYGAERRMGKGFLDRFRWIDDLPPTNQRGGGAGQRGRGGVRGAPPLGRPWKTAAVSAVPEDTQDGGGQSLNRSSNSTLGSSSVPRCLSTPEESEKPAPDCSTIVFPSTPIDGHSITSTVPQPRTSTSSGTSCNGWSGSSRSAVPAGGNSLDIARAAVVGESTTSCRCPSSELKGEAVCGWEKGSVSPFSMEAIEGGAVLHRDLKPENLLLTWDYHVKIADFGSACFFGDTNSNTFAGTAPYMSPEMVSKAKTGKYSDLWSLGCILFQLVEGRSPFSAKTDYLSMQQIKKFDPESLRISDEVAADAADLIRQLLQPVADDRLGSDKRGGFSALKRHPFFSGIVWETVLDESNLTVTTTTYNISSLSQHLSSLHERIIHHGLVVLLDDQRFKKPLVLVLSSAPRLFLVDQVSNEPVLELRFSKRMSVEVNSPETFCLKDSEHIVYRFRDELRRADIWAERIALLNEECRKGKNEKRPRSEGAQRRRDKKLCGMST